MGLNVGGTQISEPLRFMGGPRRRPGPPLAAGDIDRDRARVLRASQWQAGRCGSRAGRDHTLHDAGADADGTSDLEHAQAFGAELADARLAFLRT
jgi:hypothetical protein